MAEDKLDENQKSSSLIDRFLEMLPEMHIKGYSYCGPNTDLNARLARGEPGINELDCACREHDIAYAQSGDREMRNEADKILVSKAFTRIFAKASRIGERFAALIVSGLIGIKIILNKLELYVRYIFRNCLVKKKKL